MLRGFVGSRRGVPYATESTQLSISTRPVATTCAAIFSLPAIGRSRCDVCPGCTKSPDSAWGLIAGRGRCRAADRPQRAADVPYHARVARHLAIYTGSFDPITLGHLDVLARTRKMFDEVILAIGRNPNKEALFSFEERLELARALVAEMIAKEPVGAVIRVEHYTGLTVDYAKSVGACAIVRGIRNITDLAGECQLAITNRQVAGIETVFIVTGENFAYTSSSLIKQIAALGGSIDSLSALVPPLVIDALRRKRGDRSNPLGRLAVDGLVE